MPSQQVSAVTKRNISKIEEGGAESATLVNQNTYLLEAGASRYEVISRSETAPPVSPVDQDAYLIATGPTGVWSDREGQIAFWSDDNENWLYLILSKDIVIYVSDEDAYVRYNGSAISNDSPPFKGYRRGSATDTITASTTQIQGQGPLTTEYNRITVCANTNDTVTMPSASKGDRVVLWNDGAQTAKIFAATSDKFQGGSVNGSVTLAAAGKQAWVAIDNVEWLPE